jgi:hypothetical protein
MCTDFFQYVADTTSPLIEQQHADEGQQGVQRL